LLARELSTPGIVLGFLQAAGEAYRMGGEFVDFGHFVELLLQKLPSAGYASTSKSALSAAAAVVQTALRALFVEEKHSEDVPHATGLNVYLPDTDSSWKKRSKLFYQLYGYKNWTFLVGYIYGMRSGDLTDSFVASDLLSWKNAPAQINADAANVSVARSLMEGSLQYAVSAHLRYGVQAGEETVWVGQTPAVIDNASSVVTGTWNWKLLTLSNGRTQCAVYHEQSGLTMIFHAHFYKYGHLIQRAFGVFSIESNRWSLYANKTTGSAEIAMDAEEAWLVPLVQDADGRMVETWAPECTSGLYYMKCVAVAIFPRRLLRPGRRNDEALACAGAPTQACPWWWSSTGRSLSAARPFSSRSSSASPTSTARRCRRSRCTKRPPGKRRWKVPPLSTPWGSLRPI
jgi:hypothetical protein